MVVVFFGMVCDAMSKKILACRVVRSCTVGIILSASPTNTNVLCEDQKAKKKPRNKQRIKTTTGENDSACVYCATNKSLGIFRIIITFTVKPQKKT